MQGRAVETGRSWEDGGEAADSTLLSWSCRERKLKEALYLRFSVAFNDHPRFQEVKAPPANGRWSGSPAGSSSSDRVFCPNGASGRACFQESVRNEFYG
jgi:hypothetical protein